MMKDGNKRVASNSSLPPMRLPSGNANAAVAWSVTLDKSPLGGDMRLKVIAVLLASGLAVTTTIAQTSEPKVGPVRGTVFAVGGGVVQVLSKVLEAAGGPDKKKSAEATFDTNAIIMLLFRHVAFHFTNWDSREIGLPDWSHGSCTRHTSRVPSKAELIISKDPLPRLTTHRLM